MRRRSECLKAPRTKKTFGFLTTPLRSGHRLRARSISSVCLGTASFGVKQPLLTRSVVMTGAFTVLFCVQRFTCFAVIIVFDLVRVRMLWGAGSLCVRVFSPHMTRVHFIRLRRTFYMSASVFANLPPLASCLDVGIALTRESRWAIRRNAAHSTRIFSVRSWWH